MTKHERVGSLMERATAAQLPRNGYGPHITRRLRDLTYSLGMSYFLMVELPRGDRTTFEENLVAIDWPEALMEHYRASDLFFCSKIMTAFRRTIVPVSMGVDAFGCTAANHDNRRLEDLVMQHGAETTFGFTLHDVDMNVYAFAFSGTRPPLSKEEQAAAVLTATELLDSAERSRPSEDAPKERLSHREVECLRWTAAGKSSDEIGMILDLSSHTVVGYLKTAMRKLDTVNRMQAVARAYRFRLL